MIRLNRGDQVMKLATARRWNSYDRNWEQAGNRFMEPLTSRVILQT